MKEIYSLLSRMVRVGNVMNVDKENKRVRVKFQDEDITSGWLRVIQHFGAELFIEPDAEHTHAIHDTYTGGGNASVQPSHDHLPGSHVTYWTPNINDVVLCLYLPTEEGDGYVLGGI